VKVSQGQKSLFVGKEEKKLLTRRGKAKKPFVIMCIGGFLSFLHRFLPQSIF